MKKLGILLLLLFVVAMPQVALAQSADLDAKLNFNNEGFGDRWNLLRVTVDNTGDQDIQGVVEVRYRGRLHRDVFIEQGKELSLEFYLPPQEIGQTFFSDWTGQATVALLDSRGREIEGLDISVERHNYDQSRYAGVVTNSLSHWQRLSTVEQDLSVVGMEEFHFNNPLFMRNFSYIILSNPGSLNLKPEQVQNLSDWVGGGGTLIIGGGGNWQRNQALVDSTLLPFAGSALTTVSDLATENPVFQFPAATADQYPLVTGSVSGEVLLGTTQQPLMITKAFGSGQIHYSTLDLQAAPFDNALNFEGYWRFLLTNTVASATTDMMSMDIWILNTIFSSFYQGEMSLGGLTPLRVFLGLFIYVIIIGPVNFLVLRRIKRLDWAWLTIPLAAVIFTTGTFAVGSGGRSSDRITYHVGVVELLQQDRARTEVLAGIYVPGRGSINAESSWSYLAPARGTVVRGRNIEITNPPMWSVQRLFAADVVDLPGTISMDVQVDAGRAQVTLINTLGKDMFDGYFKIGSSLYQVGPLAAGETKTVHLTQNVHNMDLQALLQHYQLNPNQYHYYPPGFGGGAAGVSYYGFTDEAVKPLLDVGDRSQVLDIIIASDSMASVHFTGDDIDIPRGWFTPTIVGTREPYAHEVRYILNGNDQADLIFTLPDNLNLSQGYFQLHLEEFWGEGDGQLLVWSRSTQEWLELDNLRGMSRQHSQSYDIADLEDKVDEGKLLFRIKLTNGHVNLSGNGIYITLKDGGIK